MSCGWVVFVAHIELPAELIFDPSKLVWVSVF